MDSKQFVIDQARLLHASGATIPAFDLAMRLNASGCRTSYGTQYMGERGTYTLIATAYNYLENQGLHNEARMVATAFTKPNGDYAYN